MRNRDSEQPGTVHPSLGPPFFDISRNLPNFQEIMKNPNIDVSTWYKRQNIAYKLVSKNLVLNESIQANYITQGWDSSQ